MAQSAILETAPGFRCWSPRQQGSVSYESWTSGSATPRSGQTAHKQSFRASLRRRLYIAQVLPWKATTLSAAPSYPAPSCASLVGSHRLFLLMNALMDSPDLTESSHQSFYPRIWLGSRLMLPERPALYGSCSCLVAWSWRQL